MKNKKILKRIQKKYGKPHNLNKSAFAVPTMITPKAMPINILLEMSGVQRSELQEGLDSLESLGLIHVDRIDHKENVVFLRMLEPVPGEC